MGAIVAAALAAIIPMPLLAADPGQLDCTMSALDEAQRRGFADYVAELGGRDDPRWRAVLNAHAQCGERFGWSLAQSQNVMGYLLGDVGQAGAREQLRQQGVDVGVLEQSILQNAALLGAASEQYVSDRAVRDFLTLHLGLVDRMLASVPDRNRDQVLQTISGFVLFRAKMEVSRRQFVAG